VQTFDAIDTIHLLLLLSQLTFLYVFHKYAWCEILPVLAFYRERKSVIEFFLGRVLRDYFVINLGKNNCPAARFLLALTWYAEFMVIITCVYPYASNYFVNVLFHSISEASNLC